MITFDTKDLDRVEKSLLRLSRVSSDPKLISKVIRKPMRDASKPILADGDFFADSQNRCCM